MTFRRLIVLLAGLTWSVCGAEVSNAPALTAPVRAQDVAPTNDPVELEYKRLLALDDAAAEEIDGWLVENQKFEQAGGGVPRSDLAGRIEKRREPVRSAYEDFLKQHPNHGRARLAFASFLEDGNDNKAALQQMLKAKEVDPGNPAVWNNIANYYGHFGEVTNAFVHYEKAIELDPNEPVYYHNFGTTVYLFRRDAMQHYGITEQQVFDKALMLYSNSLVLDPKDFLLATDIAMTYYGIQPPRTDAALEAWKYALHLAEGSLQREGVLIHLARIEVSAGRLAQARTHLNSVTNADLADLKARVLRNLEQKEHPESVVPTNAPPAATGESRPNDPPTAP